MPSEPLISIVMPSFNSARFIRAAAESVMNQDSPAKELIVMDGGSTDGTVEILRELAARYPGQIHWASNHDRGQSDAINKGFSLARGEILAWLNSDDRYEPGALSAVAEYFRTHPSTRWVFGHVRILDARGREIRKFVSAYKAFQLRRYSFARHLGGNFVSQMGVFFRKDLWREAGGLDLALNWAMDYDLWLRFGKIAQPGLIDRTLACFRMYGTTKTVSGFEKGFGEDLAVARRYAGAKTSALFWHRFHNFLIVNIYRLLGWFEGSSAKKSL
ncbi:MAG: glycosyltransferase family 2 protein [Candidatus Omnitrophota bacterium]